MRKIAVMWTIVMMVLALSVVFFGRPAKAAAADWSSDVKGAEATCAAPREKNFSVTMEEVKLNLGNGLSTEAWTFNGTVPGPTMETCVGDKVTIHLTNKGTMAHGLDTHAFRVSATRFGPVEPGKSLDIVGTVDTAGVYMYHCAAGTLTDQHIKMSMSGAMIVYPRETAGRYPRKSLPTVEKEMVVVTGSIFGEPNDDGFVAVDSHKMDANAPALRFFNGRFDHKPIEVKAGKTYRVYTVNTSPGVLALHVIGTILDKAHASGNPENVLRGVQTFGVEDGNGAIVEFKIPEAGTYLLVDHDNLAQLPNGYVIPFVAK